MSTRTGAKNVRVRVLVLLVLMVAVCAGRQSRAADVLAEGKSLFEAGRYDLAREKLTAHLNAHPGDAEALFYLGRIESKGPKAQEYFQRVVDESPRHQLADNALSEIADYYYARGYYITAQRYYGQILRDYPQGDQTERAQFRIGQSRLAVKKPGEAREALEKLIEEHPKSEWALQANAALVEVYLLEEDWENAVSLAEELIAQKEYAPLKAFLLKNVAEGYKRLGRNADADVALQRILVECPKSLEASRLPAHIQAPEAAAVPVDTTGNFAVQVGAFADSVNAYGLREAFKVQGFSAFLTRVPVDSLVLWRVRIGPYRTEAEAALTAKLVQLPDGSHPTVVQIKKQR